MRQVALSGGEPLLRPDLPGIVNDLTAEGLGVVVITSGALLTDKLLEQCPATVQFEFTLFSTDERLHDRIAGLRERSGACLPGCSGRDGASSGLGWCAWLAERIFTTSSIP